MRGPAALIVLVAVTMLALTGCTVTREGTIRLLPDGEPTRLTVILDGQAGTVHGVHPRTGEALRGRIVPLEPSAMPTGGPPDTGGVGSFEPQPAPLTVGNSSRKVAVTLRGDTDTVLECVLSIRRGLRPSGTGSCMDGSGERYAVKF